MSIKDQKLFNGTLSNGNTSSSSKTNRIETKVNGSTSPSRTNLANGVASLSVNGDESEENVTMLPPPKAGKPYLI